jgi:hypothetical protein
MSLVGKCAIISGENYYHKVDIVQYLKNGIYLVQNDLENGPANYFTISLGQTVCNMTPEGELIQYWLFFDTREEREKWIEFMSTPPPEDNSKGKVVKFTKH